MGHLKDLFRYQLIHGQGTAKSIRPVLTDRTVKSHKSDVCHTAERDDVRAQLAGRLVWP